MMSHIILPSALRVIKEEDNTGVYEIDGLYPGYGHTFGNAIRRILLSSIPSISVCGVKIAGVSHEFETIPGVLEDVILILLNLRKVHFQIADNSQKILHLSAKGKKVITAADFQLPGEVTIANPDQRICEITDASTKFDMDVIIDFGTGFIPRDDVLKDKISAGYIALDAVFTPIRKASYEVEKVRVGDRTDYNMLRLNIETNGTISPGEALDKSIRLMIDQMSAILKLEINADAIAEQAREMQQSIQNSKNIEQSFTIEDPVELGVDLETMKTRVDALGFSSRTERSLDEAGVRTIGGLIKKTEEDLLALPGFGEKSLSEVKECLASLSISLKKSQ